MYILENPHWIFNCPRCRLFWLHTINVSRLNLSCHQGGLFIFLWKNSLCTNTSEAIVLIQSMFLKVQSCLYKIYFPFRYKEATFSVIDSLNLADTLNALFGWASSDLNPKSRSLSILRWIFFKGNQFGLRMKHVFPPTSYAQSTRDPLIHLLSHCLESWGGHKNNSPYWINKSVPR